MTKSGIFFPVQFCVVRAGHYFQIRPSIVQFIVVSVMNVHTCRSIHHNAMKQLSVNASVLVLTPATMQKVQVKFADIFIVQDGPGHG